MEPPTYGLLLYGATGFTSALTAYYLATVPGLVAKSWAIAGRSQGKLDALLAELPTSPAGVRDCWNVKLVQQ